MFKQLSFLLVLIFVGMYGRATNRNLQESTSIITPAVKNSICYNYQQINNSDINCENESFSDDFNLPVIRNNWTSIGEKNEWTVKERPGYLRLSSQDCSPFQKEFLKTSFSKKVERNVLGEAICSIDLSKLEEGDKTGLFYSMTNLNYVEIEAMDGKKVIKTYINNHEEIGEIIQVSTIMLRTQIDETLAWFEYSTDGLNFKTIGHSFLIKHKDGEDDSVGVFCLNSNPSSGFADFDWFYLNFKKNTGSQFAENTCKLRTKIKI